MLIALSSQFRVVVTFVILFTFLLCYWGNLFCPMVYASGEAVPHHSTPQSDPLKNDAGCPELAIDSTVHWGDANPAILSIESGLASHQGGTAFLVLELSDRSFSSSSYLLLYLLLSTLRN